MLTDIFPASSTSHGKGSHQPDHLLRVLDTLSPLDLRRIEIRRKAGECVSLNLLPHWRLLRKAQALTISVRLMIKGQKWQSRSRQLALFRRRAYSRSRPSVPTSWSILLGIRLTICDETVKGGRSGGTNPNMGYGNERKKEANRR